MPFVDYNKTGHLFIPFVDYNRTGHLLYTDCGLQ